MRFYDIKNPVVIIYEPRCSCVVGKLNELLVHYEIADDRLGFTKVPRWIKTNIDFLIEKADLVTVASQYLYDKLIEKRRHNIFLVGNGVEVEHFKKAREDIEIPKDICNVKKPILGYVGTIGEWFDFQLIEIVLNKFPNISIVIVGPIFPEQEMEINRLKKSYHNFYALGKKSYNLLPNFIRAFDACIIPFKINELTRGVNPNKLYEYLAAGKPVISTALPEVKKYDGTVYVAENYDEFLSYINKALTSTHDLEKFFKIANENTWEEKAKEMVKIIQTEKRGDD
jgi:glycosyltransferase involved in cell wall biosynthesis